MHNIPKVTIPTGVGKKKKTDSRRVQNQLILWKDYMNKRELWGKSLAPNSLSQQTSKKEKSNNSWTKHENNNKSTGKSKPLWVITLNANGLNFSIKMCRLAWFI